MREVALVLACGPVELIGTDSLELGELRVEDLEVKVVAQVDPGAHEEGEVGSDEGVVEVIEDFGGLFWLALYLNVVGGGREYLLQGRSR